MCRQRITAAILIIALLAPGVQAVSDCGCGGNAVTADSCCRFEYSADDTSSCCSQDQATKSTGCCGNSGDACKCSESPSGCQCGDDCRCGKIADPPSKDPVAPSSQVESVVAQLMLLQSTPTLLVLSNKPIRPRLFDGLVVADCLSSPERCSKLCRFLR